MMKIHRMNRTQRKCVLTFLLFGSGSFVMVPFSCKRKHINTFATVQTDSDPQPFILRVHSNGNSLRFKFSASTALPHFRCASETAQEIPKFPRLTLSLFVV